MFDNSIESQRPEATTYFQGQTNNTLYRTAKKILCISRVRNRIFLKDIRFEEHHRRTVKSEYSNMCMANVDK